MEYTPAAVPHYVLCADCGTPIEPNSANLCIACLRNTVDITEGIPKQSSLNFCRNCERYLAPPQNWIACAAESRELLAICLRKLKGLAKVRLIDASFIWTEPHSKRIRVKLSIQKEVFTSTILQQIFEVEYIVAHGQCPDCTRLAAKNMWKASVQVRQKVNHKRTFLFLEQLILRHNAHKDTVSIKEAKDGLDFFFLQRSHAIKMCDFLAAVTPVRTKSSEQLLSTDTHSGSSTYKFSYSVEIVPICKDDLVVMPLKMARGLSNINPLTICTRIGPSIQLIDPTTLQSVDLPAQIYWRTPFDPLASVTDLVEFLVLDIEPSGPTRGKHVLADCQVTFANTNSTAGTQSYGIEGDEMDGGGGDGIYHTRTHLGGILQPGDTVLGYHLTRNNFNNDMFDQLDAGRIPDVILVKKTYPNRRKKARARNWKLKSIAIEAQDVGDTDKDNSSKKDDNKVHGRGALGRRGGLDQQRVEKDYEMFLRELEEDPELRSSINLYKNDTPVAANAGDVSMGSGKAGSGMSGGKTRRKQGGAMEVVDEDHAMTDGEGDAEMAIDNFHGEVTDNDEEDEEDFPEVQLDELLDQFEGMGVEDDEAPAFVPQEGAEYSEEEEL